MSFDTLWNRFTSKFQDMSKKEREAWLARGRALHKTNQGVQTRQVLRRRALQTETEFINKSVDAPRKNRRRMALGRMRRFWKETRQAVA